MYAGINVLTKLMYFQQILYLLGVNKYYGYGYGYGYGYDSFFKGGHIVCGRGRRRTCLSSRHFAPLMCFATWPITAGQSTDCLAWGCRTIPLWATKMFRNHIHSAARKHNSQTCLATAPIIQQLIKVLSIRVAIKCASVRLPPMRVSLTRQSFVSMLL